MVAEEVVVTLSGGAPWGFRLQGGVEQQTPLQVAKVRRRSKACRADLREEDELVAIGDHVCAELNHAQAMMLIDSHRHTLNLRVKRSEHTDIDSTSGSRGQTWLSRSLSASRSGFHSVVLPGRIHTATHTDGPACFTLTSPPDSEAYYGETDSDADTHTHRRQRHTPPDARPEWTHPARPVLHHAQGEPVVGGEVEGDSGFQEAGGGVVLACSPLVSPERARGAMMLGSSSQMVPTVGAQLTPLSDELSATYKEKARQAKLQRGESVVDRQVKEARTKCRSIASLLTDAPNSNSKGVLMFKKRRQRAKKFTLTCFGRAEGEVGAETGGETEGEEEEGSSFPSGSEVDEEGFAGTFDPTWDSEYLDMLDRRSSMNAPAYQSPGQASVVLTSPSHTPIPPQPDVNTNPNTPGGIHNRTARPFTSGLAPSRPPASPVIFRPVQPTPGLTMVSKPTAAVSMVTIAPPRPGGAPEARRAVSSTSLYIPPRPTESILSPPPLVLSPPSSHTCTPSQPFPSPSVHTATFSPSSDCCSPSHYPPQPTQHFCSLTAPQPFSPPPAPIQHFSTPSQPFSPPPPPHAPVYPSSAMAAQPFSPPSSSNQPFSPSSATPYIPSLSQTQPPPPLTFNSYVSMTNPAMVTPSTAQTPASDSLSSREQRIAVPASRTGILAEARRRSNKKPMFRPSVENKKDVSPNPALLELLQNPDAPTRIGPGPMGPSGGVSGEAGGESGPEEDWLKLGAEACNFMQAQRGSKPPPVAPKPQPPPQVPQLAGKGGQLFARRQSRMDRYVVETPSSPQPGPSHPRQPSPTPSLPSQFKYSSSCRAPPPISYNPLLSPSCPPQAQRQRAGVVGQGGGSAGHKAAPGGQKAQGIKALDFMSHQPYQLNSSLFSYGGGTPQGQNKMPRVYEVKRFSTPPPTGPAPTVIIPRSATTLGEPMWRSDVISLPPTATSCYQSLSTPPYQPQPQWVPPTPAPTGPLPQTMSKPSDDVMLKY
uniref:Synaptopodin 2-like protein n=1 Tax=Oncorhynchus kisutch TaxID=8019 RepID=A0A8C7H527_ONCKI